MLRNLGRARLTSILVFVSVLGMTGLVSGMVGCGEDEGALLAPTLEKADPTAPGTPHMPLVKGVTNNSDVTVELYYSDSDCASGNNIKANSFVASATETFAVPVSVDPGSTKKIYARVRKDGLEKPSACSDPVFYTAPPVVYAAGFMSSPSNIPIAALWKDGVRIELPVLVQGAPSEVLGLVTAGGKAYAVGYSTNSDHQQIACYWVADDQGVARTDLVLPNAATSSKATGVAISESGDVYISGAKGMTSQLSSAGYWKNGEWVALENPNGSPYAWASSIKLVGRDVYVVGDYSGQQAQFVKRSPIYNKLKHQANAAVNNAYVGYWLNGQWVELPGRSPFFASEIGTLTVVGTHVVAAGTAYTGTSDTVPGYWFDGIWSDLAQPSYGAATSQVITVDKPGSTDPDIYFVGCNAEQAGSYAQGALWKNGRAMPLPSDNHFLGSCVSSFQITYPAKANSRIYLGGYHWSTIVTPGLLNALWSGPIDGQIELTQPAFSTVDPSSESIVRSVAVIAEE